MTEVSVLVEAGKATAAAPLGPALGPLGVNIGLIVSEINQKTKSFEGMKVPVKILIDSKKNFEIVVGSPPTSALIKKELGLQKGSGNPKANIVGDISMKQVIKIAKMKQEKMNSMNLKANSSEIIGTCNSLGITIEGKPAKIIQKEIKTGKYDSIFKEE